MRLMILTQMRSKMKSPIRIQLLHISFLLFGLVSLLALFLFGDFISAHKVIFQTLVLIVLVLAVIILFLSLCALNYNSKGNGK